MKHNNQLIVAAPSTGAAILGALLAAFVLTLLLLVVFRLARRSGRKTAQEDTDEVVADLRNRIDSLAADLKAAFESNARDAGNGGYEEIGSSIDLDEVLARTLDAAAGLPGADAALVSVDAGEDAPIVAAVGLPLDAAERQRFAQPPDAEAEAVVLSYRYRADAEAGRIRAAVAVPLGSGSKNVGWLAVYSGSRRPVLDDAVGALGGIAARAAPAVENALRYREARRLADLDALTGLHNRRYFHETLGREVARAQRYRRELALIVIDVDDFKAVNEQIGHLAGDGVLAEAAERIRSVVRQADVACRVGGDEFAIILPESGLAQADQLFHRLQAAVATPAIVQIRPLSFSAGVAELSNDDDATSLFERADAALYRAKGAGKARAHPALAPTPPEPIGSLSL